LEIRIVPVGRLKTYEHQAILRIPPTGFEPVISCVKGVRS
jgi:hypothetical protein